MGRFVTYVRAKNVYEALARACAVFANAIGLPNPFDYVLKVEHVGGWIVEFEIEKAK